MCDTKQERNKPVINPDGSSSAKWIDFQCKARRDSQFFEEGKGPTIRILSHVFRDLVGRLFEDDTLAIRSRGTDAFDFTDPPGRECFAELVLWECEVVLYVETGGTV